ncbi:MAG: phosphohistidine phosphatase SixA [Gemmataceae bacterium]
MLVYLIRHAEAVSAQELPGDDAARSLTAEGKEQARRAGYWLRRLGIALDAVYTSPLLRAQQTAEVLYQALAASADRVPIVECPALAPGGKPKQVAKFLRKQPLTQVALIGHEPDLGRLTGWWIGSRKLRCVYAKAGIGCIQFDGAPDKGAGTLLWLARPEWMTLAVGPPQ